MRFAAGGKTLAAFLTGYAATCVTLLMQYLDDLDTLSDVDPLTIVRGALYALLGGGVTGAAYRTPAPTQPVPPVPQTPVQGRERTVERPITLPSDPVETSAPTPEPASKPQPARRWSTRSLRNLEECHADLQRLAKAMLAASPVDFIVIDGARTPEEQREHIERGSSRTKNSRHLQVPSHAFDFLPLDGSDVDDPASYVPIVDAGKIAANRLGISVVWGHDWDFVDSGHVELDRNVYPDVNLA